MKKLLIIDKDGTLVRSKSGSKSIQSPNDQELLPGVEQAVKRYADEGWRIHIAINQQEVETGAKTLEAAVEEMRVCLSMLPRITGGIFCLDAKGEKVERVMSHGQAPRYVGQPEDLVKVAFDPYIGMFRKPEPGMFLALKDFVCGNQVSEHLVVSTRLEDEQAAVAAGMPFMQADEWRQRGL